MIDFVRGFTVIELLIVVLVIAVLTLIAAPSFQSLLDRQRVRAAASNFGGDVQFARSEAVRANATVTVSFSPATTPWCYGVVTGAAVCNCTVANSCDLKAVSGADFRDVTMTLTGGTGFSIDPRQGRVSAIAGGGSGAVTSVAEFASSTTPAAVLDVQVNSLGRVALCSPSGTLAGYPTC